MAKLLHGKLTYEPNRTETKANHIPREIDIYELNGFDLNLY